MEKQEKTDLGNIIGALKIKIDAANTQILQLGLLVEYLYKELEAKDIGLDIEGYPEWAQKRFEEIHKMAETDESKELQANMRKEMESIAKNINLNL